MRTSAPPSCSAVTSSPVAASGAEVVVDASPARLDRFLSLSLPVARVRYAFRQLSGPPILDLVVEVVERARGTP